MTAVLDKPQKVSAVVGLLVLFEITSGFIQGGVAPLLPDLGAEMNISDANLNWVISVQLLAAAVSVPAFGRLGDLYGHRRMLRVALACVAVGSVLVVIAPNLTVLLAGRALLGPLAALLPLEIALVRDRLPVELARRAIARLVGALALGGLLGGVITAGLHQVIGDARLTLLIPAILAVICVPVSFLAVPETAKLATGKLDLPGVAVLSASMVALLSGISLLSSAAVTGAALALAGLAGFAGWIVLELRTAEPLVDLRALAGRHVAPFFLCSFVFGIVYFGSQAPDSTFLAADRADAGYGFGFTALQISLVALPAAVAAVVGSNLTAVIAGRFGYRPTLIAAFLTIAVTFLAQALFHDELWQLLLFKVPVGLAAGVALGAMPTVIAETADASRTGITTALYNNVKTLGGAVAGAVVAAILAALVQSGGTPTEGAYVVVWLMCSVLCVGAAAAAVFARRVESV
ncbi:putative MFS transporter [Actinoplanes missouriensis 431]|uniref:Putative MFS transporter n=1 Tax=Actinoplanes missouriensis (strain ATCC 14538 / DSM 43046 / CBS 188.64 / JCM 3121 / NBRC 102363 / NCIMB 12654 / NRRL B-3342 / UNCC 431) TaxID=512565 RepID=I0GZ78_ACTM4|nr:MFS transporter [Actinoplanes missouriensis]BAL86065.1 putative MFS transporter [Actinoplanes missouriensis 431]